MNGHFGSILTEAMTARYSYAFLYGMGDVSTPVKKGSGECLRVLLAGLGVLDVEHGACTLASVVSSKGGWAAFSSLLDDSDSYKCAEAEGEVVFVIVADDASANHVKLVPQGEVASSVVSSTVASSVAGEVGFAVKLSEFFCEGSKWYSTEFHASDSTGASRSAAALEKYRQYLEANYVGGVSRFFSPTGFLQEFQVSTKLRAAEVRKALTVSSLDHACTHLSDAMARRPGVYDLAMPPGTGKTSELAFRFPDSSVLVAMPTPFDAWSAFMSAAGPARLDLVGLQLGKGDSRVVYTDSYKATHKLLTGDLDFQVLLVDECNSRRALSSFLSSVQVDGVAVVRMSGSFGTDRVFAGAFGLEVQEALPDYTDLEKFRSYVLSNAYGRSLVLMPSAEDAAALHELLPGSVLISSQRSFADLASGVSDQTSDLLYVSDQSCSRGSNLNLDVVFDTQYVKTADSVRVITKEESMQRRSRLSRNKRGVYHCAGHVRPSDEMEDEFDVARTNVACSLAGLPQVGPLALRVSPVTARSLMCSSVEPGVVLRGGGSTLASGVLTEEPSLLDTYSSAVSTASASSPRSSRSGTVPAWAMYLSGTLSGGSAKVSDYCLVTRKKGKLVATRKSSRSSSGSAGSQWGSFDDSLVRAGSFPASSPAATSVSLARPLPVPSVPSPPPTLDLADGGSGYDWPAMLKSALTSGARMPQLKPSGGFVHTAATGMDTDWSRRLDEVSRSPSFSDGEFEVVARSWNWLVARSWVGGASAPVSHADFERVEFCLKYYQSFHALRSV